MKKALFLRHGLFVALGVLPGLNFAPKISAQSVATVPVGAMTYTFPATTQLTGTYMAIPLMNPPVFAGPVQSYNSNTIVFSGTPFASESLAQAGSPFFARITSGSQAGRMMLITANTANSITLDITDNSSQTTNLDTVGFALAANDRVEVIVGDTLASLFGDNTVNNPLFLVGASAPLSADNISIYNKSTSKYDGYYFNTTLGYWRTFASAVNANNTVIYPQAGLVVSQRAGRSARTMTIVGQVPTAPLKIKVTGSFTGELCSTTFPVTMTLGQLNIANWTKANSALSADTVGIYNPLTSKMDTYFQRLDNTWRKAGDSVTDQSGFLIDPTMSFTVFKRAAVSAAGSYLSFQLPYSL